MEAYKYIHTCIYMFFYTCTRTHTYTNICTYICICTNMNTHAFGYVYTCIYTYIDTCIHTCRSLYMYVCADTVQTDYFLSKRSELKVKIVGRCGN